MFDSMFKGKPWDLRKLKDKVYYKPMFYIFMACSVIVFFGLAIESNGASMKALFFSDRGDSFMDHYNSVIYNYMDPYENYALYPPLAAFTYKMFLNIIPVDVFNYIIYDPTKIAQPQYLKLHRAFVFQFILFSVIVLVCLFVTIYLCKKGSGKEKIFFSCAVCLSGPFLFMVERGNNILIPLFFTMLFVCFHDSKYKVVKELSLIFLALAVAFKLYPVAFGVLLFRNKQYKELFRAGVYCILFTVLPFFIFYNGIESIKLMIENISRVSGRGNSKVSIDGQLNFNQMFHYITGVLRLSFSNPETLAKLFRFGLTGICVISAFITREDWKAAMLCACILYGFQGTCSTYLLIFFIIPVMMLLDGETKNKPMSYIYLLLMLLTLMPIAFPDPNVCGWSRYVPTKISSLAVLAIVGIGCLEALIYGIKQFVKFLLERQLTKIERCLESEGGAEV